MGEVTWAAAPRAVTRVHTVGSGTVHLAGIRVRLAADAPRVTAAASRADSNRMAEGTRQASVAGMRKALAEDTPEDSVGEATHPMAGAGGAMGAVAADIRAVGVRTEGTKDR